MKFYSFHDFLWKTTKKNLNDFKSRLFYPGFCFYFYFPKGVTQINRKVLPQKVYFGGFTAFAFFHEWCSECTQHVHVGFGNEKNLIRHHAISLHVRVIKRLDDAIVVRIFFSIFYDLCLNFLLVFTFINRFVGFFLFLCRWFVVFVAQRRSPPERLRRPAISGRRWRISAAVGQQRIDFIFIARRSSFIRIFRFWWRQLASPRRQSPGRPLQRPVVRTQVAHLRSR